VTKTPYQPSGILGPFGPLVTRGPTWTDASPKASRFFLPKVVRRIFAAVLPATFNVETQQQETGWHVRAKPDRVGETTELLVVACFLLAAAVSWFRRF
jgi:hypothetical protein